MRPGAITIVTCFALAVSPQILASADVETSDSEAEYSQESASVRTLTGDETAGEKLYRRNCRACHGATAGGAASYPKLVGHPTGFLVDRVARYRAGERFGANTPLMAQGVRKLSDQNIADVAAFIVSLDQK
ncbi:MAG: c-type cytochrome [Pseudomonadota bacterium]